MRSIETQKKPFGDGGWSLSKSQPLLLSATKNLAVRLAYMMPVVTWYTMLRDLLTLLYRRPQEDPVSLNIMKCGT